jgi:hypothetical protein
MKSNNEESNLLGALVEETYRAVDTEGPDSKVDLSSYFEMKSGAAVPFEDHILEDTMLKRGVVFSVINYCNSTSCFKFKLSENEFCAPENWGDFSRLKLTLSKQYFSMINDFNNELFIDGLFSEFVNYDYSPICFAGNGKAFLIFVPKEEEEVLSWLKKYCEVQDLAA